MCEYCVQHGHGQRWYLSAHNYVKELAHSRKVNEFCDSFFGRTDIVAGAKTLIPSGPPTERERQKQDFRYQQFLHHQVVTTKEAQTILELASKQTGESDRVVVLLPCICRYSAYGKDPDLSCYGIAFTDEYTRRFPKYCGGNHKYVSLGEAQDALENLLKTQNIVHAISALGVPYLGMLCNCDMPVCRPYLVRQHFGITSPFYKGHARAIIDNQKCTGCGTCQEVCPFAVAKLNSSTNLAEINATACYGCGTCQRHCPENAITLRPVENTIQF